MPIHSELLSKLACPICGGELLYDEPEHQLFCSIDAKSFLIEKNVPLLIFCKVDSATYSSEFNYLEHYKTDAEEFDYFEEQTGATAHSERRLREYIVSLIPRDSRFLLDVGSGSAWMA